MSEHDLYQELLELAQHNNVRVSVANSVRNSSAQTLDQFKSKVKDVKAILAIISKNNTKILALRDALAHNASAKKEQEMNNEITSTIEQNAQLMVSIRALLAVIDKLIEVEKEEREGEPETMSKIYQKKHLLQQVTRIMKESSKIQVLYKKWTVADAVRNIQLFDSSVTEQKAMQIAKSANGYQTFLKQKQMGKVSLKMRHRIQDIIEKNRAIKKLQKSILQNLQMMKQIAVMVKEQGELLDSIEENMMNAHDYVQKATQLLKEEKKIHQKNRKKICIIIFVGLAILAIIMVPIIVKMTKKK